MIDYPGIKRSNFAYFAIAEDLSSGLITRLYLVVLCDAPELALFLEEEPANPRCVFL